MKKHKKRKHWGNSILAINNRHRLCDYCGKEIESNKWFEIKRFNGYIYTICSATCLEAMSIKHELKHGQ